jgi:hypothetical protein
MAKQLTVTKIVVEVLSKLTLAEQRVLIDTGVDRWFTRFNLWALCFSPQQRFGPHVEHNRVLDKIATELGYTVEEIRKIEARALRKLMHPSRFNRLTGILDGCWLNSDA